MIRSLANSWSSFTAWPKRHILSCVFPALSSEVSCLCFYISCNFFILSLFNLHIMLQLWAPQKQGLYHAPCNLAATVMHGILYTMKMFIGSIYILLLLSLPFVLMNTLIKVKTFWFAEYRILFISCWILIKLAGVSFLIYKA